MKYVEKAHRRFHMLTGNILRSESNARENISSSFEICVLKLVCLNVPDVM